MPVEIVRVQPGTVMEFVRSAEREALKTFYDFSVIWHEQTHDFAAMDGEQMVGVAQIHVAASLANVHRVIVLPQRRGAGIGRALLRSAADVANYYNCHKMTALVPHRSAAQKFFERCDYREEAILPQHTFKLDMAAMRKFLL
ncbi:MAG TPA: GNAT family N-acetyltransferase [Candidatus Baltobacteraceae bacterium]|nr:GNAT family N-acetyltransferase [Candidatus Baltobacteraceae bacterium]